MIVEYGPKLGLPSGAAELGRLRKGDEAQGPDGGPDPAAGGSEHRMDCHEIANGPSRIGKPPGGPCEKGVRRQLKLVADDN